MFLPIPSDNTDLAQECRLFEIDLPNTLLNFFTAHTALSVILLDNALYLYKTYIFYLKICVNAFIICVCVHTYTYFLLQKYFDPIGSRFRFFFLLIATKSVAAVYLKSGKNMVQHCFEQADLLHVGKNLCETALL